jgi:hypothetical protein
MQPGETESNEQKARSREQGAESTKQKTESKGAYTKSTRTLPLAHAIYKECKEQ